MNLKRIDVYPTENPYLLEKKKYTYKAVLINLGQDYYYLVRGVKIKISKHEYEMLLANPEIRLFSYGLKLHLRVDLYLLKNKGYKTGNDKWGIWFITGFLNKFPSA
jgi:hypothetical protein